MVTVDGTFGKDQSAGLKGSILLNLNIIYIQVVRGLVIQANEKHNEEMSHKLFWLRHLNFLVYI